MLTIHKGSSLVSPVSAPGDALLSPHSECETSSNLDQSERSGIATNQISTRIKRAYSAVDLGSKPDPITDFKCPETQSLRLRTRSGGSLPKNQSESSLRAEPEKEICEMSETASLNHDWNPAILTHSTQNFESGQNDSLNTSGDPSVGLQSPERIAQNFNFDSNSVILRNDVKPDNAFSEIDPDEDMTVMAGGRRTGWSPDVAYVLWKRILGIVGDVNDIENPEIHARVFTYLHEQYDIFLKVRENLGVSTTNMETPSPPTLVPPLFLFAPWCFGAFQVQYFHISWRLWTIPSYPAN